MKMGESSSSWKCIGPGSSGVVQEELVMKYISEMDQST